MPDHHEISKSWRNSQERITPIFGYPPDIRKAIYTTNAIDMDDYFHSFKARTAKEPLKGITHQISYLDKTMMSRMEFEPDSKIPEHKHPHEQITMILEGKMELKVGGENRIVSKGDVVVVSSDIPHSDQIPAFFTVAIDAWSPVRDDYK